MKVSIEFPDGDTQTIADIFEAVVPINRREELLRQLENPCNVVTRDIQFVEDIEDRLMTLCRLCDHLDNHSSTCQALALRREDLCSCDIGRIHRFVKEHRSREGCSA
jgi:hypothetical protein